MKNKIKLTKKQTILIIVASVVLAIAVALSITLPLVLIDKNKVPEISFAQFDRKSDYSVTVNWKKINGTQKYTVEYCYGERIPENIKKLTTENVFVSITRQIGVLSVRVRADEGEFCEWKSIDIPALKLKAPARIAISENNLTVSWSTVNFDYYGKKTPVSIYSMDFGFDGKYKSEGLEFYETESLSFASYVVANIEGTYDENAPEGSEFCWKDVEFIVKLKATVQPKFSGSATAAEQYLKSAYDDSDYIEASIVVTKEIYEGLKEITD